MNKFIKNIPPNWARRSSRKTKFISLSSNAKYFGIIDPKKAYNLNWDVVWSFTYALTGTQHGFSSFLNIVI
jgi:hypothetical protein